MEEETIRLNIAGVCTSEELERSFFEFLKHENIRWGQDTRNYDIIRLVEASDFDKLYKAFPQIIKL